MIREEDADVKEFGLRFFRVRRSRPSPYIGMSRMRRIFSIRCGIDEESGVRFLHFCSRKLTPTKHVREFLGSNVTFA